MAAYNRHEGKEAGQVPERGTAAMVFGQLVEQYDLRLLEGTSVV